MSSKLIQPRSLILRNARQGPEDPGVAGAGPGGLPLDLENNVQESL